MKELLKNFGLCAIVFSILFGCNNDANVITISSEVSHLAAVAGEEQVILTWSKPLDTEVKEYWITIDPLVLDAIPVDKNLETYTIDKLEGNKEYRFTLLVKNMSGGVSKGVSATAKPTPIDRTPPAEVTNLSSQSDNGKIILSWTKSTDSDLASYVLSYEPGGGSQTLAKDIVSYNIEGLTNDTEYTITIKTKDVVGNISTGAIVKATPKEGDNTPPAEASELSFSGDYGATQFTINWRNPVDTDFNGTEITYFYGSESQVTVTVPKTGNSYIIDGSYEQNYTLTLKTKDETGNYSTGVTKKVRFGNYSPTSQANLDSEFNEDIVAILAGKLKINGTDITDLSKFSNLEVVEGKFDIASNANLTNLNAFSKMKKIGSRIYIDQNAKLTNFCGLKNLISVGGAPDLYTVTGNASNPTKQEILDNCN